MWCSLEEKRRGDWRDTGVGGTFRASGGGTGSRRGETDEPQIRITCNQCSTRSATRRRVRCLTFKIHVKIAVKLRRRRFVARRHPSSVTHNQSNHIITVKSRFTQPAAGGLHPRHVSTKCGSGTTDAVRVRRPAFGEMDDATEEPCTSYASMATIWAPGRWPRPRLP